MRPVCLKRACQLRENNSAAPALTPYQEAVNSAWVDYLNDVGRSYGKCVVLLKAILADPTQMMNSKGLSYAIFEESFLAFHHSIWIRVAGWILLKLFYLTGCRKFTPQYNDYLMAKWHLTGDCEVVWLMHHRARHCPALPEQVVSSCRWMMKSVYESNEEFRQACHDTIPEQCLFEEFGPDLLQYNGEVC